VTKPGRSFANGNSPNAPDISPEAAACATTFWELVHGTDPRLLAS
jgi:hypothetical protein